MGLVKGQNSPEGVLCVHREVSSIRSLKAFTAFKRSALKAAVPSFYNEGFAYNQIRSPQLLHIIFAVAKQDRRIISQS